MEVITESDTTYTFQTYLATVTQATDYAAFGAPLPGRTYILTTENYAMGFNGKMMDNDIYGTGNAYDFGARIFDSRLGRWCKTDPYEKGYAPISAYVAFLNNPIYFRDGDGNRVKGIDGKDVTISYNESTKTWTINGQPDEHTLKLFTAMLKTPAGAEAVQEYINHKNYFTFEEVSTIEDYNGNPTKDHALSEDVDINGKKVGTHGAGPFDHFRVRYTLRDVGKHDRMHMAEAEEKLNIIGTHEKAHVKKAGVFRDFFHHRWGITNQKELVSRFQYAILYPEKSSSMDKWIHNYDLKMKKWRVNRAYRRAVDGLVKAGLKTFEEGEKLKNEYREKRSSKKKSNE